MRYKVIIKYDGSKFYGSQVQKDKVTVLGEVGKVLSKICNENVKVVGCSRTDRGVHANNFVFHFDSGNELNVVKIKKSLNKMLMPSIYVKEVMRVSDEFHARYSVKSKCYVYKINTGEYSPCENDYVLQYNKEIDLDLMNEAASLISGKHDFRSFTSDGENDDYVRDISISIEVLGDAVYIYFKSKGFLRYMIRNIVGLLLLINDKDRSVNEICGIFKSRSRSVLGKSASGCGLYLESVEYE